MIVEVILPINTMIHQKILSLNMLTDEEGGKQKAAYADHMILLQHMIIP